MVVDDRGLRMRVGLTVALIGAVALGACAGRDPQIIATVQPQDQMASCLALTAEMDANNLKFKELADEQGLKTGQNVAAGVVGLVVWPMWFAMDFKGAADKDVVALQARQKYLTVLAAERCAHPAPPPQRRRT
jgi:hypothetical protein